MLIINAKVYPMVQPPIEPGFVWIKGDKIAEVGPMCDCPTAQGGERVFDAKGQMVLPGFIDAHCHIGICEDSLGFEGEDCNEETDPATPQLRAIDAVNPRDQSFSEAARAGVTTVVTGPGSANPVAGQSCALKTAGRFVDEMALRPVAAMKLALGENPKMVYHGKSQAPVTRMATASVIREQLTKARRYLQDIEKAKEDEELDEPELDFKCEALLPLLRHELKAHIHAHRADDIMTAVRICKEFDIDYVLIHCTDGRLVADRLQQEGAQAVVGPIICAREKPELSGLDPSNAGELYRHGVKVAICTDHPVVPLHYLALSAGLCVANGLPYDEALKAITLYPAQICQLEDRVGSLQAGLDADIVVFPSDPLSVYAKPSLVMIGGQIVNELKIMGSDL